ncbi:MAG: DUF1343 domain-containing protein, partial [Candidatus Aminicenantes bacterium]|nr:DUF1343 domain-containing protein [Candidatus Aminicenantes bacterium]
MKRKHILIKRATLATAVLASLLAAGLSTWACRRKPDSGAEIRTGKPGFPARVRTGLEVLAARPDPILGKRIGLITNPSGVDSALVSSVEVIRRIPGAKLVALYAPEHGVRGDAQAGEYVPFYFDKQFRLPVFSLYGPSQKPQPGMMKDIDAFMRSFDTSGEDKQLEPEMTREIDTLLFDVQDVGTRVYTYAATMAYAMQNCAENGVAFIVLDRPNPVNGRVLEGPILESPAFSSFIGLYPIPLRFGLTVGEMARLIN